MIPSWVGDYIGIPFVEHGCSRSGCDCYGLVKLIYDEKLGKKIKSFCSEYETVKDRETISKLVEKEACRWSKVKEPIFADAVVLLVQDLPCHIGMFVGGNTMIHTEKTINSVIEELDGPRWKNRVEGFYRFNG